jgi:hypothetical protein
MAKMVRTPMKDGNEQSALEGVHGLSLAAGHFWQRAGIGRKLICYYRLRSAVLFNHPHLSPNNFPSGTLYSVEN